MLKRLAHPVERPCAISASAHQPPRASEYPAPRRNSRLELLEAQVPHPGDPRRPRSDRPTRLAGRALPGPHGRGAPMGRRAGDRPRRSPRSPRSLHALARRLPRLRLIWRHRASGRHPSGRAETTNEEAHPRARRTADTVLPAASRASSVSLLSLKPLRPRGQRPHGSDGSTLRRRSACERPGPRGGSSHDRSSPSRDRQGLARASR